MTPAAALFAFTFLSIAAAILFLAVLPRWRESRQTSQRIRIEDALKHILNRQVEGLDFSPTSLAGVLEISTDDTAALLAEMQERGLIEAGADSIRLTDSGRRSALHILRAHRLWERYLADETGIDELEWHSEAERAEHKLSPEETARLSERLGNPAFDPHGDPIPPIEGEAMAQVGTPLIAAAIDEPLRIVHIEDEPRAVYAQLVAEGLYPGMELRVLERTPTRLTIWAAGDEHVLAPLVAVNVSVDSVADGPPADRRLSDLKPGERSQIVRLSEGCRGLERRRLQDLGFLPGTEIEAEMGSDPVAYRIRGALIALRREQADEILVRSQEEPL